MVLEIVHHILCSSSCALRHGPLLAGTAAAFVLNSRGLMTSPQAEDRASNNITHQSRQLPEILRGSCGGRYIAGGFNKTVAITGQPPADRVVILQFENMDKVKAWRDAARDAQEKIGSKYATFRTFAVEGVAQY
jgi:hypothetical protein